VFGLLRPASRITPIIPRKAPVAFVIACQNAAFEIVLNPPAVVIEPRVPKVLVKVQKWLGVVSLP
jgi:hypothetical protein